MNIIRAILFNFILAIWTVLIALIYLPCLVLSAKCAQKVGKPWAKGTLILARIICGISYRIEGRQYISSTPVIYASKHQSALEITILMSMFPAPAFVLKRALLFLPFFGQYLWRMKMIAIDRKGGGKSLRKMLNACVEEAQEGRSIVIFPEGTRMPIGSKGHYHPGVAAIYQHVKIPVIPIAVNTGYLWPRNRWIKRPGVAVIKFLPPIAPGLRARDFLRTLEAEIETNTEALGSPLTHTLP